MAYAHCYIIRKYVYIKTHPIKHLSVMAHGTETAGQKFPQVIQPTEVIGTEWKNRKNVLYYPPALFEEMADRKWDGSIFTCSLFTVFTVSCGTSLWFSPWSEFPVCVEALGSELLQKM